MKEKLRVEKEQTLEGVKAISRSQPFDCIVLTRSGSGDTWVAQAPNTGQEKVQASDPQYALKTLLNNIEQSKIRQSIISKRLEEIRRKAASGNGGQVLATKRTNTRRNKGAKT